MGGDLNHYLANYPVLGKLSFHELFSNRTKYGYIFALLCKIAYSINPSNTSFLFVTSIFSLIPVALFINRFSPKPGMSVFLYITFAFYTDTFNNVRASMALGLCLIMMIYVVERKPWHFIFLYLLALEIHQTVLPFLFVYPLYSVRLDMKRILFCIGGCFVISQLMAGLMGYIMVLASLYDAGAYNVDNIMGESYSGGYNLLILMVGMTFCFLYVNKARLNKYYRFRERSEYIRAVINKRCTGDKVQLFMVCLTIACCILCFSTVSTELTRLSYFYTISIIVMIPISVMGIKSRDIRMLGYTGIILFFLAYFHVFIMTPKEELGGSNSQHTIPYYTFWQKTT